MIYNNLKKKEPARMTREAHLIYSFIKQNFAVT